MARCRAGQGRLHLHHLIGLVAYCSLLFAGLVPAIRFEGPDQCLYLTLVAFALPWASLVLLRTFAPPGPLVDWATPLLVCSPVGLVAGLLLFAEALGLDPGYHDLALAPAFLSFWSLGPWLTFDAIRLAPWRSPTVDEQAAGTPRSVLRGLTLVSVIAGWTSAAFWYVRSPLGILILFGTGWFLSTAIRAFLPLPLQVRAEEGKI